MVGEHFSPVERAVPAGQRPEVVAARALIAGPTAAERRSGFRTAIPRGATLRSVAVASGAAKIDLGFPEVARESAFAQSLRPARIAQVVSTLKALPSVRRVSLFVDGAPQPVPSASPDRPPPEDDPDLDPRNPPPPYPYAIQDRLYALRYLPKEALTGEWDYRTEQAVIAFQSWTGIARDGDVGPQTLAAMGAAAVPKPTAASPGRRIEVYRARGVALFLLNGKVVRAIHVATGAAGFETPAGTYSVFRKERFSWSIPYKVWLPYASYFNGGIAFHAYPEVPTYPASHGCVRVPFPEAKWVYGFARLGTTVAVY